MTDDEFPSGGHNRAEYERDLKVNTVHSVAKVHAEAFAEYIIEKAGHTVTVPAFHTDNLADAIQLLDAAGFRLTDAEYDDGVRYLAFAHPALHRELHDEVDEQILIEAAGGMTPQETPNIEIYDLRVWADHSMPEGTAVILHPEAIVPTPPSEATGLARFDATDVYQVRTRRPWAIRHPEGVCVVEVSNNE